MKKPIDIQLTKEGLENLKKEQQELIDKRPTVLTRLVAAREQGDLSENAGYHAAKEEIASIDRRLRELKMILRFAEVIEAGQNDLVEFGSQVAIDDGTARSEYTIVGALEANPAKNKVSNVSPIGSVLIGKKVGQSVEIDVPQGKIKYKIISIK